MCSRNSEITTAKKSAWPKVGGRTKQTVALLDE